MKAELTRRVFVICLLLCLLPSALVAQHNHGHEAHELMVPLSPTVKRLLDDPIVSDERKTQLRIFHGQWDDLNNTELSPFQQAQLALLQYKLHDDIFENEEIPAAIRAEALRKRGELEQVVELLKDADLPSERLIYARSLEFLGKPGEAIAALEQIHEDLAMPRGSNDYVDHVESWLSADENKQLKKVQQSGSSKAKELVAIGQSLVMLSRMEGVPSRDYHRAMEIFGDVHSRVDRLYWPAMIAEAELLMEKHNGPQAAEAILQAARLNPHSSEAWGMLGQLSARTFQFDKADQCIKQLKHINENHLLADMIQLEAGLTQKEAHSVRYIAQDAIKRYPKQRELIALWCAVEALSYDASGFARAMQRFDDLSPGHPQAIYYVGKFFALARQYDAGEKTLRQAIEMAPNWAEPRSDLGLMLMQSGDEAGALIELRKAAELDPFNVRVKNQLQLVEHLAAYKRIETEHFTIKFADGIDEVLARDMPEELESIYRDVTSVFDHKPRNRTLIEVFPNERWFGVRITGVPEIWTIAASTGDVIAMTPPREGVKQRGTFDWARVLRHEFVHTVTLDKTANRLPHWFTEACAVSQEPGGRDFQTCELLVAALENDRLFDLTSINIAFVRPSTPLDRPLAYAEAAWIFEYIVAEYGHSTILDLLGMFALGQNIHACIEHTTGKRSDTFMEEFKAWARGQVKQWGFDIETKDERIEKLIKQITSSDDVDTELLAEVVEAHPKHPDVLMILARLALERRPPSEAYPIISDYALARPVDPWAQRALAQTAMAMGRTQDAIGALQQLDSTEQVDGRWALQLAKLFQQQENLDAAAAYAKRALHRQPYNATIRELAATIALQRSDLEGALHHVTSLSLLEPKRSIHHVRLAAIHFRMGNKEKANAAAEAARELDPEAPVGPFMK